MPKISIITITYNAEKLIEGTLLSVLSQSFQDYEYLIIDGASKDHTLGIVDKYKSKIDVLLSEPDKGIYDAMNKALGIAKGDYVIFMNAGDSFYDEKVLENVFSLPAADIYYGETMLVNDDGKELGTRSHLTTQKLPNNLTKTSLRFGMVVCHQSFIVKREIAPTYNQNYKYSADVDWMIKCIQASSKRVKVDGIIAKFLIGGISKDKHKDSLKERFHVLSQHYGLVNNLLAHAVIVFRALVFKLSRGKKNRY